MKIRDKGHNMTELDVHGMNKYQARIAIDSSLRRATAADYRIRVIHGYQSGDSLREMIASEYSKHPRVLRIEQGANRGRTELVLREY